MEIISFDEIRSLNVDPIKCYDWVSEAIERKSEVLLPAKISLKPDIPGTFYNTMPVIIPYLNVAGVKEVIRYPKRIPSLDSQIIIYDLNTGKPLAIMDGNWITAMRTGAVATHSINLLAVKDFSVIGCIGLGNVARATMKVLLAKFNNRELTIKLKKYKNQHELFAGHFSEYENVHFEYVDNYSDVIYDSDVVISAVTVFEKDICPDEYFKKGVLVVPIHTRGFTNCDLFFDKVFADDVNHVKGFKYFDRFRKFSEVSDVVNGNNPGRENDEERIIAYNIGIALHDIYFASKIYSMCGKDCPEINLDPPTDKFWM